MKPPFRVLLVDDSVSMRSILKVYLLDLKVECLEAGSAGRALSLVRLMSPHLIIADVNMPETDGIEMLHQLRAQEKELGRIPVLLLTGDRDPSLEQRGRAAGADAFIHKPIKAEAVVELVRPFLEAYDHGR